MNNNIVPSLIIAASIVAFGLLVRQEIRDATTVTSTGFLKGLASISEAKDDKGESIIKKSVSKIIEDLSTGAKEGFTTGMASGGKKKKDFSDLEISQVQFTTGRMNNEEKIIGIIHNKSNETYSDLSLSVSVKDKDGKLIDVINDFVRVEGQIGPNKDIGFSVNRSYKAFGDKEDAPEKRGTSADVTIVKGEIVK